MEIIRFADARPYTAANHGDVSPRRLQGGDATRADFVLVGHSHFPAGATVPMEASDIGKIYVVVEGTLTIEQADGAQHRLDHLDSVFVPAGEARAVINNGKASAAIIVITPPPR